MLNKTMLTVVRYRCVVFGKPGINLIWFLEWGLLGSQSAMLMGWFQPALRSRPISAGSALRCEPAEGLRLEQAGTIP